MVVRTKKVSPWNENKSGEVKRMETKTCCRSVFGLTGVGSSQWSQWLPGAGSSPWSYLPTLGNRLEPVEMNSLGDSDSLFIEFLSQSDTDNCLLSYQETQYGQQF